MAVGTVTWDRWALLKVVQRPFQHTLSAVMILSGPTAKRRNCPKPGSPPAGVEDGRPVHRWPGPPHRPPTQSAPATERPLTGDATKGAACDPVHLALLGGVTALPSSPWGHARSQAIQRPVEPTRRSGWGSLSSVSVSFHHDYQAPQTGICLPGTVKGDTTTGE